MIANVLPQPVLQRLSQRQETLPRIVLRMGPPAAAAHPKLQPTVYLPRTETDREE